MRGGGAFQSSCDIKTTCMYTLPGPPHINKHTHTHIETHIRPCERTHTHTLPHILPTHTHSHTFTRVRALPPQPHPPPHTHTHTSVRSQYHYYCYRATFQSKTGGYNPNQDALHQLPLCKQTAIFLLRTGHCRLNSRLKRISIMTSAQCPFREAD